MIRSNKHKRSLGGLRLNPNKQYDNQPDHLGRMFIKREDIEHLYDQLSKNNDPVIEVAMASWFNSKRKKSGAVDNYLSVEISPLKIRDKKWYFPEDEENIISTLERFFT